MDILQGFDPLAEGSADSPSDRSVFEEATRRVVQNILKSYTGYWDLFSELLQNSLDAIDKRLGANEGGYMPQIWIEIDIAGRRVRIVDNGCGMTLDEVKFCFRPNVSFKNRKEARGHKGVGATFLAYGFGMVRLSTKTQYHEIAVRLAGGRQWSDDYSGAYPRPKLELEQASIPELAQERSGTSVEVSIHQGQRPDLGWWNATSASQWYQLLRMKTPLGGVYLSGKASPRIKVNLAVTDLAGNRTNESFDFVEYPYPHELQEILPKVKEYEEIKKAVANADGDSNKIPQDFKRVDAFYGVWTVEQILEDGSPFANLQISAEDEALLRRHEVSVYGCFLSSAKQWAVYQKDVLRVRASPLLMKGGLQIASDNMIQGDLFVIPLTSTIGYQAATHVIVHFVDGNPDMGRKVFQPELKALAETLAKQVVSIFKRFLHLMREDTGAPNIVDDTDTYNWLDEKRKYRIDNPLEFAFEGRRISYTCTPSSEQDLVALFHELVGLGVIRGVRFLCTSEHDRYDGCYVTDYTSMENHAFSAINNPFGVSQKLIAARESRPFILEYKYDLDGLIADFEKEAKHPKEINTIICWSVGNDFSSRYALRSYLVDDEGAGRQFFGATHSFWHERIKLSEVICVSDLLKYLSDPDAVRAEHRTRFKE